MVSNDVIITFTFSFGHVINIKLFLLLFSQRQLKMFIFTKKLISVYASFIVMKIHLNLTLVFQFKIIYKNAFHLSSSNQPKIKSNYYTKFSSSNSYSAPF